MQLLAVSVILDVESNTITVNHEGMPASLAAWLLEEASEQVSQLGAAPTVVVVGHDGTEDSFIAVAEESDDSEDDG